MTSSIINSIERPEVTQQLSENIILTTVDDIYNWVKMSSLLFYGIYGCLCFSL
jgi:NAD(P)H-quinone oxidoreductase subunit K